MEDITNKIGNMPTEDDMPFEFSPLPIELQCQIWKDGILPRVIAVREHDCPGTFELAVTIGDDMYQRTIAQMNPASRYIFKRNYKPLFGSAIREASTAIITDLSLFCPAKAILNLDGRFYNPFVCPLVIGHMEFLQQFQAIAIPWEVLEVFLFFDGRNWMKYKEYDIMQSDWLNFATVLGYMTNLKRVYVTDTRRPGKLVLAFEMDQLNLRNERGEEAEISRLSAQQVMGHLRMLNGSHPIQIYNWFKVDPKTLGGVETVEGDGFLSATRNPALRAKKEEDAEPGESLLGGTEGWIGC